ncbi:MAG: hypothetical protein VZS44_06710 [Bacilli bacterium]|nr:hypothetical protein [Bacilli bacterium]
MDILYIIEKYLNEYHINPDFFQLYSSSTENINSYMQYFDLNNKSLLTTGSSSDQAINATLAKCNDITVCDICPLTKYYYYLKLASLLVLNRKEFLDFICIKKTDIEENRYFLLKSTFNKIKSTLKHLDYESYYVWEYLFKKYSTNDIKRLFREDVNDMESIIYCNRYLKNDYNYNHVKETVINASINFINEDMSNLNISRSFDNIWLSNIPQHLNNQENEKLINNSIRLLNDKGKILLCYFWNTSMTVKGFPIEYFKNIKAKKQKIMGISKNDDRNSILLYTR